MEDWGLQAVIRPKDYDDHHHQHQHQHQHHDHHDVFGSIDIKKEYDQALLFCYPHLFDHHHHHHEDDHRRATTSAMETTLVTDELDQLYKPFYHAPATAAAAAAAAGRIQTIHHHHRHHQDRHNSDQEIQQDQEQEIKNICGSASNTSQLKQKLKKRKNQQKRVVVQVTADGLSSDPWAWRKYGQKPIKGSSYPRSYYRCSSSKGCIARRQVEQSCTDSSIYILTYTADHNHPQPTRRNSLAGINRSRFKSLPKSPTSSTDGCKTVTTSKDSPFHSPLTTLSVSSIDDELIQQSNIKQESEHTMMSLINDDDYVVFNDDFFEGLEDLGGYTMDSSSYNSSTKQFPHVFC